MKAVILARVSTEEQKEAGNSLPAQLHRMQEYCKRKEFPIVETFSFDESAYKTKRDEFDKILEYLEKTTEKIAVVFDKVDRLSRNVFDKRVSLLYEKAVADVIELHFSSEGQVISSSMSAVEKFQFGMSLGLAKYYSDAISDNVRRAFEQKLRNGEWIGQTRVGYKRIREDGKTDFIVDTENAHFIKKMFELYATGNYSTKTLQQEMERLGMKSRNDLKVGYSMIHKILRDKFYIGIMTSKGQEFPHSYPRIVPESLFMRVQGILNSYNKKTVKFASKPFALRGMVKCADCGCTVTPEIKKGRYIYYSCSNAKGKCKKFWVREEDLLQPIREALANIRLPQERADKVVTALKQVSDNKNHFHQKAIAQLQSEYNRLQTNTDRLIDLLVERSITQEIYDKKLKDYKEKQHEISIRLDEYTRADESFHIAASTVFSLANRALEIFESSEPNEKRQLLSFLTQNCRLSQKNLSFELRSPFNLLIDGNKVLHGSGDRIRTYDLGINSPSLYR